jgi:hypothetical protein
MPKHTMKMMVVAVFCGVAMSAAAFGAATKPPFKDAVKVWNFADGTGLKAKGAVRIGVKLDGGEKAASLKRGGDGLVVDFSGGYLVADPGLKVTGKQMTLLMRARDPSGKWKGALLARPSADDPYANLLYGSQLDLKKLGFRERARMKDGRSLEFLWRTDALTEQVIPEFLSRSEDNPYRLGKNRETWTKEISPQRYPDLLAGVLKVAAPVELIGPDGWHDILIRFTGPKLQLFIDGVLVDEEFPHGELRHFESPFLIGAGIQKGVVTSDFRGQMDTLAIWDRALSDSEIAALSGGQEHIARRRVEIEGDPVKVPQYWRPEGYNAFVGDPMPFFHDETFHFFYLFDRKHSGQKWGIGGHPWGHVSSRDLVHWERHPKALDITEPTEDALGTGNFIFHDGKYYLYWINHGRRLPFADAPDHRQADNVYVATSADGIHFEKQAEPWVRIDYRTGDDINPFVWRAASGGRYYMYIMGPPGRENWLFESDDLRTWRPAKIPALHDVRGACVTYYRWKGWYYWFDWSGYRMSRTPAEDPGTRFSKVISWEEAWGVPAAAPFTGNRLLMVGFARTPAYASQAIFRELVQHEDGTLGLKWPAEMIPASREPMPLKIRPLRGEVSGDASSLRLRAGGRDAVAACFAQGVPDNVRITLRVAPEEGASGFGLCVRGQGDYASGQELCFEPEKKRFRYAVAPDGADVPPINPQGSPPTSLKNVAGLDRPFALEVIVKDDFVDVCIDNRHTLFLRRDDFAQGDRLFFFVRKGAVKFDSIKVRPLKE